MDGKDFLNLKIIQMEQNKNEQTNKSLQTQCNQRQLKTLDLSKNIVSGNESIAILEMGLTLKDTFESPNIRSVFKAEHGQIGYSVVSVLVKRFMDSFGFSTKMSDTQIEVLTVDTLEKFSFETLEDIILFFKMARTGKFGTTMRGVDSNLIFGEWYPMYLEIKAEYRELEYQKEKVAQSVSELSIEDVKKAYNKIQNKGNFRDKVSNYVDKITEGITRQELENIISEWSKDDTKKDYIDILKMKRLIIKGDFKF